MKLLLLPVVLGILFVPKAAIAGIGGGINVGFGYAPIITTGIEGFFSLGDLRLGAGYLGGSSDLTDVAEAANDTGELTVDKFNASVQQFSLNASYSILFGITVSAAIGKNTLSMDYSISDSTGGNTAGEIDIDSTFTKIGVGLNYGIGPVYFGAEILGIMVPASSSVSSTLSTTLPASGSDLEELNQDMVDLGEDIGESTSYSLFLLKVGIEI